MKIKTILCKIQCSRFKILYKKGLWIHPSCVISSLNPNHVRLGEKVSLHNNTRIDCDNDGVVELKEGCDLNIGTRIEAMQSVVLQPYVLTGPYVYISDRNHEYRDVKIPIIKQGYFLRGGVLIGAGTWIGIHAVILGPVTIGKGCVIGANTVVTKDLPDYSVAVGNPMRIIKRYNQTKDRWEKVSHKSLERDEKYYY